MFICIHFTKRRWKISNFPKFLQKVRSCFNFSHSTDMNDTEKCLYVNIVWPSMLNMFICKHCITINVKHVYMYCITINVKNVYMYCININVKTRILQNVFKFGEDVLDSPEDAPLSPRFSFYQGESNPGKFSPVPPARFKTSLFSEQKSKFTEMNLSSFRTLAVTSRWIDGLRWRKYP